jgi:hypothetical protein
MLKRCVGSCSRIAAPFVASIIYLILTLASIRRVTFSKFLVSDDNVYLPVAVFGGSPPKAQPSNWLIHVLTAMTGSVSIAKLVPILAVSATCAILVVLLRRAGLKEVVAVPTALLLVIYPIDASLGIFVIGSYAFYSAPFVLLGILTFWDGWINKRTCTVVSLVASLSLFSLAGTFNPSCTLLIFIPMVWVAFQWLSRSIPFRQVSMAAAVFAGFVFMGIRLGYTDYHYTKLVGWVEYTPSRIWENLWKAIDIILLPYTWPGSLSRWLLLISAFLLIGALIASLPTFIEHRQQGEATDLLSKPRTGSLCALLIMGAGLTFGPGAIVVNFIPRYVTLPFLLVATAASIGCVQLLRSANKRIHTVVAVALFVGVVGSVFQSHSIRWSGLGPRMDTHDTIVDLVERDLTSWAPGAQVVLVLPKGTLWPTTSGFNHWSSGYLQLLTNREDVTGLVGRIDMLNTQPFVESWQPNGWWSVVDGKSSRARMKGLTLDQPNYFYFYDNEVGWSQPLVVGFTSKENNLVVVSGTSVLDSGFVEREQQCEFFAWEIDIDAQSGVLAPVFGNETSVCQTLSG